MCHNCGGSQKRDRKDGVDAIARAMAELQRSETFVPLSR